MEGKKPEHISQKLSMESKRRWSKMLSDCAVISLETAMLLKYLSARISLVENAKIQIYMTQSN